MRTPKRQPLPEPEPGEPLDLWAAKIAALEPDVARGVVEYAQRIADNARVPKADRDLAQAQADAVKRAVAKAKRSKRK